MTPWVIWFIISVILILFEVFIPGFWIATFAIGTLSAGIISTFVDNLTVQLITFVVVTLITMIWLRPIMKKYFYKNSKAIKTNASSYIGEKGIVTETIDNSKLTGAVKIGSETFTALSEDKSIIDIDSTVEVVELKSTKVIVKKI